MTSPTGTGVPNLAGTLFDNQLMMSGLDGSGSSGQTGSCNLGKDESNFCSGGLFSDGKVKTIFEQI